MISSLCSFLIRPDRSTRADSIAETQVQAVAKRFMIDYRIFKRYLITGPDSIAETQGHDIVAEMVTTYP